MSITAEMIVEVLALVAEGKKAGTVAMMKKIKKSDVEAIIAGTITAETLAAGTEVLVEEKAPELKVEGQPGNEMLEQLKAQQAAAAQAAGAAPKKERKARSSTTLVKVKASSSKDADGNSVQRRNTNCDTRAVAAFYSPSLNMCWIGSHLGFATKTPEGAMKIMRTAPQKALDPLKTATDVIMVIEATNVQVGPELEQAKMDAYLKYEAQKFTMLCRKPKIEAAAPAPEATPEVVEEIKPEVEAVEQEAPAVEVEQVEEVQA